MRDRLASLEAHLFMAVVWLVVVSVWLFVALLNGHQDSRRIDALEALHHETQAASDE